MRTITKIPRLKPRAADTHKGDFGKVYIIAGSRCFSGTMEIAAKSTFRGSGSLQRTC